MADTLVPYNKCGERIEVAIRRVQGHAVLVSYDRDGQRGKAIVQFSDIGSDMCVGADVLDVAVILPNIGDLMSPELVRRRFEDELLNLGVVNAHDMLKRLSAVRGALAAAYSEDLKMLIAYAKRQRRPT